MRSADGARAALLPPQCGATAESRRLRHHGDDGGNADHPTNGDRDSNGDDPSRDHRANGGDRDHANRLGGYHVNPGASAFRGLEPE